MQGVEPPYLRDGCCAVGKLRDYDIERLRKFMACVPDFGQSMRARLLLKDILMEPHVCWREPKVRHRPGTPRPTQSLFSKKKNFAVIG